MDTLLALIFLHYNLGPENLLNLIFDFGGQSGKNRLDFDSANPIYLCASNRGTLKLASRVSTHFKFREIMVDSSTTGLGIALAAAVFIFKFLTTFFLTPATSGSAGLGPIYFALSHKCGAVRQWRKGRVSRKAWL